jgi:hypothetical protein
MVSASMPGPATPCSIGISTVSGAITCVASTLAVLADVLPIDQRRGHGARGPPLEHLTRVVPDQLESIRVALRLGRDDLDLLARQIRWQWLAHGLCARGLGDHLLDGRWLGHGCIGVAAERETEYEQRQLRVVFR